jgi:hypothetical protein
LGTNKDFAGQGYGTAIMDFIKVLFSTNNRTGCRFLIVDALNRPETLHWRRVNLIPHSTIFPWHNNLFFLDYKGTHF